MTPEDIARQFVAWAATQGILPTYVVPTGASSVDTRALFGDIDPAKAAAILLRAGMNNVVYGEEQIIVYHARRLLKRDRADLPRQVGKARFDYRKNAGETVIDGAVAAMAAGVSPAVIQRGRFTCGCSIGIGLIRGAGTLGALVRDGEGQLYGLTNNHVIGGCNHMPSGLPVVAPGPRDMINNALDPFCVGHNARSIPLHFGIPGIVPHHVNRDAAIFAIRDERLVSSMQRERYDTPETVAALRTGMRVTKAGRTTGVTTGIVVGTSALAVPVAYALAEVGFTGNAYFDDVYFVDGHDQPFAQRGDSGALVVTEQDDGALAAVGLVFAVANTRTYMLPIAPILEALDVTLVAGHHG